jgi:hypothetical protein
MPRVSNTTTPRTPPTTGTTGAAGTTGTTGTTPAAGTSGTTPAFNPPPLRSASGDIIPTNRAVIDGLQGGQMNATSTANRFSRDSSFDGYVAPSSGKVDRAFIRVDADPIPGGCRVNVKSYHKEKNDKVTLWLVAEVLDTKTKQLRTITLSTLNKGKVINSGSYRGDLYYDVSYADVNKYLQSMNPNLKLSPGNTSLAVSARWSNGHQAGGFGRGGMFRLPPSGQAQSIVDVRAARDTDEADLPLDMQVSYPAKLVKEIPQLKPDGDILSRLESELKGTASKKDMTTAIANMYGLAEKAEKGDKAAVEKALGKDWTVKTVNRYWIKDDGSAEQPGTAGTGYFKGFRVDADGLPMQDPMHDVYMDDESLGMTSLEGAIRLRTNKQATVINVKPGGGREDNKTRIRQRVEYGLEMKPGTTASQAGDALSELSYGFWSGTVFNEAQRQVAKLPGDVELSEAIEPWLDVRQDRHKFTVLNEKTGVEIEFSFDKVNCKTLRSDHANADGTPREAEFYVLEAELDHLQLQSTNQSNFAAGDANGGYFSNDSQQSSWLKGTSDQVTMDIDPRLHELKDLENKSFRATTSYKQFETAQAKIIPWLFPNGLGHGRQKAAHAADAMDLVHFDDKSLKAAVKDLFEDSGYKFDAALAKKVDAAMADPAKRMGLSKRLLDGTQKNPYQFAQYALGRETKLKYDLPKMKKRIAHRLHSLGYNSGAAIEKMFDKLTTRKMNPRQFESAFRGMENRSDSRVLSDFASRLGVSTAPVPRADVDRLFGENATYGQLFREQLEHAMIDPKDAPALEKFFGELVRKDGATVQQVREMMGDFTYDPQSTLDDYANDAGIQAPKLSASPKLLRPAIEQELGQHFLKMTPAMEKFIDKMCSKLSHEDAQEFPGSLWRNPNSVVERYAKDMGLRTAPKFETDMVAVKASMQTYFDNAKVKFTAGMESFIERAIEHGVDVGDLQYAIGRLSSQPDLEEALEDAGVDVGSIYLPKVSWDVDATVGWVQQTTATYSAALPSKTKLEEWVKDGLDKGASPQQLTNYARYYFTSGSKQAERYVRGVSGLKEPPIDMKALMKHLEQRFGTNWTPEREKYLNKALPKAMKKDTFKPSVFFNQSYKQILNRVKQASGVARPTGV